MKATTSGTRRRFWAEAPAPPNGQDRVWRAWTDPATWEHWDQGLRRARLVDAAFVAGARGEIVDLNGRVLPFVVTTVDERRALVVVTFSLPGARLVLTRHLVEGGDRVRHEVAFTGPFSVLFGAVLGGRFRALVGPSLEAMLEFVATG
ncbi:MAG: SRPBCC family protein [Dermatophilaceae bacterium]